MNYRTYVPHNILRPFVRCYWSLDAPASDTGTGRERIFPDGCMELVFHLGDLFRKYISPQDSYIQPRSFIHGQLCRFMEIAPIGRTSIFAIRFQPHGLRMFLPLPLYEITGQTPALSDCWGQDGRQLEDRVLRATTDADRITVVDAFLLRKLKQGRFSDTAMGWSVDYILHHGGHTRIDDLATALSISKRQFERRFVDAVGIQPKLLWRIIRFQGALRQLEQQSFNSLTQVAYNHGFYDQAHFTRDFQEFTGLSPKQYFAADLELVKHFVDM